MLLIFLLLHIPVDDMDVSIFIAHLFVSLRQHLHRLVEHFLQLVCLDCLVIQE